MIKLRGKKPRPKNIEICLATGRERIYYRVGKGPRVRLPGPLNSTAFMEAYELARTGQHDLIAPIDPPHSLKQTEEEVERRLLTAIKTCRSRAARKGWKFDIDTDWAMSLLKAQEYRCSLTGILFLSKFRGKTKVHPYTPSIDRIDSKQGYTKGNTRIVVFAINAMMMDWGETTFAQVAKAYRTNSIKKRSLQTAHLYDSPAHDFEGNNINNLDGEERPMVGGTVKRQV